MPGRPVWIAAAAFFGALIGGLTLALFSPIMSRFFQHTDTAELRWSNSSELTPNKDPSIQKALAYTLTHSGFEQIGRQDDWERPSVSVYSAANLKPPPAPMTLKDLAGEAQAQAIRLIGPVPTTPETAGSAEDRLTKLLNPSDNGFIKKDPYRVDRVLVATVAKGLDALPADRILWTRIFVQPINFSFAGYTVAATDKKTLKVATIETDTNTEFSVEGGLDTIAPGLPKPKFDSKNDQKVSSEVDQQIENLGIDIQPRFLRIIRESAPGGDVAGNTAVELSILTDHTMIKRPTPSWPDDPPDSDALVASEPALVVTDEHLTNEQGDFLPPKQAFLTVLPQEVLPHCPLLARVWMIYENRHVEAGGGHIPEGEQRVSLTEDSEGGKQVEIVGADDISPYVWSIAVRDDATGGVSDLTAATAGGRPRKVVFSDFTLASELVHWLKDKGSDHTLGTLSFADWKEKTLVPRKHISNDCLQTPSAPDHSKG
jgi:hypothetical protein